ncbi:hypothetical protein WISP_00484 [Willisornis vidua]|uniref:Peptidase A2 domain-containing protein n=1 Tax=Willisornis vidua TaxID=1566151 RepID=A0ABQ9DVG1_9PASS|nr:hypothetical protein WISP_00484 [Willisornis vidua]
MISASAPRGNTFSVGAEEEACTFPALTTTDTHAVSEVVEVQEKAWKVVHERATLAGDLDILKAFPVHFEEGRPAQWRPILYPVLKDIKKAITEHDLNSPYTLGLLKSFFNAFDLTPNDIRQVASAWLPVLQYSAFEAEWKSLIKKYVNEGDYTPIPRGITKDRAIDRMYGEGAYVSNTRQAETPLPVLHKTAELAFQAIEKVAKTTTSTPSYALVFQSPKEPFFDFATRLKEAVAKQVSDPNAQDILFKSLVVEKANEECRKILRPLKNPTLLDMIEACRNVDYAREDLNDTHNILMGEECTIAITSHIPLSAGESYLVLPAEDAASRGIIAQPEIVTLDSTDTNHFSLSCRVLLPPIDLTQQEPLAVLLPVPRLQHQQLDTKAVNWAAPLSDDQPLMTVEVASPLGRTSIQGLLDTGADVTIIADRDWPESWPKEEMAVRVSGVGGAQYLLRSRHFLSFTDVDNQTATCKPLILPLPTTLWGRTYWHNGARKLRQICKIGHW